jgi:hypothetical protein
VICVNALERFEASIKSDQPQTTSACRVQTPIARYLKVDPKTSQKLYRLEWVKTLWVPEILAGEFRKFWSPVDMGWRRLDHQARDAWCGVTDRRA